MSFVSRVREACARVSQYATQFAAAVWSGVRWFSRHTIGQWDWEPPVWAAWIGHRLKDGARIIRADRRIVAALALVMVLGGGGWYWYKHRPRPHYVQVTVTAPALTEWDDNGRKAPKPLLIDFDESAAP